METMEIGTKLGSPKKNYSEASGPQNQDHPIGNKVQTEDLGPQYSLAPATKKSLGDLSSQI